MSDDEVLTEAAPLARVTDRRDLMKKVVVGGAIVWAAPSIIGAAPASAVSSKPKSTTSANGGTAGGRTLTRGAPVPSAGAETTAVPEGQSLRLNLNKTQGSSSTVSVSVTYTFSASVTDISFTVSEVDSTVPESITVSGGTVTASGTDRMVTIAGPTTTFTVTYTFTKSGQSVESVLIGPITFLPSP